MHFFPFMWPGYKAITNYILASLQGGNRYQYLDNDRWQRDNSGGYRGNYDHRSRNYGYQNPRQGSGYRQQPQWNDQYNKRGQQYAGSWSQNWRSSSRNPNVSSGFLQNWNEYGIICHAQWVTL